MVQQIEQKFVMFMDFTFNVVPFHAQQLTILMAEVKGKPRAFGFIIMPRRKTKHYVAVLTHIRDAVLSFDGTKRIPTVLMSDFEIAQRKAARKVWPQIDVRGCLFHMNKAIRDKAKGMIRKNPKNCFILKMFMRLPLLPAKHIYKGFNAIVNYIKRQKVFKVFSKFISYFAKTWFKRYSVKEWSVSDLQYRTNNHLEGTNNLVKRKIKRNPSPWDFLQGLLNLASDTTSSLYSDLQRSSQQIDRSRLTAPFQTALALLKDKEINEFNFLVRLAKI